MSNVSLLTSLAMLKVRRDLDGADYLDHLVPFVGYIVGRSTSGTVTAVVVQQGLVNEFGLNIPLRPIDVVLNRMRRAGALKREHGAYTVVGALDTTEFAFRRAEATRRQRLVIGQLRDFARSKNIDWTDKETESAFLAYLSRYSLDCLRTYTEGTDLPVVAEQGSSDRYLVNAFVRHAYHTSSALFEDVILLVENQILANALVVDDLSFRTRRFTDVTFYLDTPLLFLLLGLEGDERKQLVVELLELLRNLGAEVAVFEHTVEEMDAVIESCIRRFNQKDCRSRIVLEARRRSRTAMDLELLRGSLEDDLRSLNIAIRRKPPHLADCEIDERLLDEALSDEVDYFTERARQFDVESIRSIYTLRRNAAPSRLESAKAVLVTTNAKLAKVAQSYGRHHESGREISPVITEMVLANIAWLKAPLGAPSLPRLEVLAACYAALKPSRKLFAAFVKEADRLAKSGKVTDKQLEILRSSVRAHDELVSLTLGDDRNFRSQTIADILQTVQDELVSVERSSFDSERQRFDQLLRDHANRAEHAELRARLAVEDKERAAGLLARVFEARAEEKKKVYWFSKRVELLCRRGLFALLTCLALLQAVLTLFGAAPLGLPGAVIGVLLTLCVGWDLLRRLGSYSAQSISERFAANMGSLTYRALLRIRGLTEVDDPPSKSIDVKTVVSLNGSTDAGNADAA